MDDFKVEMANLKLNITSNVMTIKGFISHKLMHFLSLHDLFNIIYASEIKMESNKVTLADIGMENPALHDVEILQRFIGNLYQRLHNFKIMRMSKPDKNFTGTNWTLVNNFRGTDSSKIHPTKIFEYLFSFVQFCVTPRKTEISGDFLDEFSKICQ